MPITGRVRPVFAIRFDLIPQSLHVGVVEAGDSQYGYRGVSMAAVVALGTFLLAALSIICVAAYVIKPKVLEASTVVGRFASFTITIKSPEDTGACGAIPLS